MEVQLLRNRARKDCEKLETGYKGCGSDRRNYWLDHTYHDLGYGSDFMDTHMDRYLRCYVNFKSVR